MDALKTRLIIPALTIALTACGGGGGGAGENSGNPTGGLLDTLDDIPEIRSYRPVFPEPRYDGITEQASLTRQNSFYFVEAVYQLLDPIFEAGTTQFYIDKPGILDYPYTGPSDFQCISGSLDHAQHERDDRIVQVITLDQCESRDHGKAHGQVISEVFIDAEGWPTHAIATYRDLTLEVEGERFNYYGQITTTPERRLLVDYLTIRNSALDATYHARDLESLDGTLTGPIYHSHWGYVEITAEPGRTSQTRLDGAGNTSLDMAFYRAYTASILEFSLSSPAIEAEFAVSALETSMPLDDLFLWPYRDNQAPQGQVDTPELVEPGHTMILDASDFRDEDDDFVTYSWRHLSKPDGCKDALPKSAPVVELRDACRGTHELELVVSDGFNEVVRPFTVTVAGPLPQVEKVVALESEDGSESLSLQVEVNNASEAGPLSYAIAYGPPGVEVSPSGLVTGIPERLFQTKGGSVYIGIEVSNERSVVQEFTINYPNRALEIAATNRGGAPNDLSRGWQDINNDGNPEQLVDYNDTFAIIEVHEGATRYRHLETRAFSTDFLSDKTVIDYNADGQLDIVLLYPEKYVALSGEDFSLIAEVPRDSSITEQRVAELFPDTPVLYGDIDGDGADDILWLPLTGAVEQFTVEHYSDDSETLLQTYTLNVPELDGEYGFETRFVNLDDEPGDELVLAPYRSDQLYLLKRAGTVFELSRKITYPERGEHTAQSRLESLSQFTDHSAAMMGSADDGQLFEFSLLDDPVHYESGFQHYSLELDGVNGLRTIRSGPNSIDVIGVRQWLNEQGEPQSEMTLSTLTADLEWTGHQRFPELPTPYSLDDVVSISAANESRDFWLYAHWPPSYSVIDPVLGVSIFSAEAVATALGSGDLDGDGRVEAYGISDAGLYRLNSDTYAFELVDDSLPERTFGEEGPFVATFAGTNPALFVPWEFQSSGRKPRLDIYEYRDNNVQRTGTITFDTEPLYMSHAQQDVTGDGVPELIVWNTIRQTEFWVIDSSLSVVAQFTTETPIDGVFELPTQTSDSLVAYQQGQGAGNWRDTHIIQIDLKSGRIFTRSPILPGWTDKNGLACLGDNLADCTKMVITSHGVFSLK
ncbi:hypothetical protein [Marinimicrobium sp. LS-A18]|uniref:hypothetical protein n=1 Tax=Marinimicrobium sp. LS-A18 TaxID=1381596 RepID=UPI0004643E4E|nr:hypothetical protein [Marinimicrobium sp. LS-A18]